MKELIKRTIKNNFPGYYRYFGTPVFEEVEVVYELFRQIGVRDGIMLDVGAHKGASSILFLRMGWKTYAFEPNPTMQSLIKENLSEFSKAHIDGRAVSNQDGLKLPFYESSVSTGISSLLAFHESHVVAAEVETVTLETFIEEQAISRVDFLKTDTEGYDLFVLQGFPWRQLSPRFVVCEFENNKTSKLGYTYEDLARYLESQGYQIIKSEWFPIERYGAKHRWRCAEIWPCGLSDLSSWGNLIAARDDDDFDLLKKLVEKRSKLFF